MTPAIIRRIFIALVAALTLVAIGLLLARSAPTVFYIYCVGGLILAAIAAIAGLTVGIAYASEHSPRWTYAIVVGVLLLVGLCLTAASIAWGNHLTLSETCRRMLNPQADDITIAYVSGIFLLGLSAVGLFLGFVEFALLPVLGQFRLGAISRVTYYEALLQPFTLIILFSGIAAMGLSARLYFFTYDEDFKMFRDIATNFVFLFTLPIMVFASTKVIDEEIDNRTMLTLMSKPVARWQVILGKYLGILLLILVCVVTLGVIAALSSYLRYFDDKLIDYRLAAPGTPDRISLDAYNIKAFYALLPGLVLAFLQVATLAAISVAVSTRFGLAVNVTVVVLIYIAANMVQYFQGTTDLPTPIAWLATGLNYLLPSLGLLDLNQRLVFGDYALGQHDATITNANLVPSYAQIWQYVSIAAVYALFYIGSALSLGMALFRSRELS